MNYAALSAKAALTPRKIKATVDLSAVVLSYGVELSVVGDSEKLIGICPFHDDTVPSFTVWKTEQGDWSCGCWACDFGPGDLFDFLMRWHECDFTEAMRVATSIDVDNLPEPPPINVERVVRAMVSLNTIYSRGTETAAVGDLLKAREIPVSADWVIREFEVCADGDTVLIPHWDRSHGRLNAIKRRAEYMGWRNVAARGSEMSELYGSWRDHGLPTVILCEGESDTWTVSYLYQSCDTEVFGLPCGVAASPRDEWLELLKGRTVVLLFDADRAGVQGTYNWATALQGLTASTLIAFLPDGTDATSAGSESTINAVFRAAPFVDGTES